MTSTLTEAFIADALKADPAGAKDLGTTLRTPASLARSVWRRPVKIPVHSTARPTEVVGWVARGRRGWLTWFVVEKHRGRDPVSGATRHDLRAILQNLQHTHPGRSIAVVLPTNRRSRSIAADCARRSLGGVVFWI